MPNIESIRKAIRVKIIALENWKEKEMLERVKEARASVQRPESLINHASEAVQDYYRGLKNVTETVESAVFSEYQGKRQELQKQLEETYK